MERWLFVSALLLTSGVLGVPSDDGSEDYFYDEEVDEVASTHVPVFSSTPQHEVVREGATVTLDCFMDKATGVIIWQHGSDNLFTGSFRGGQGDRRLKLMTSGSKGNSLEIKGVKASDTGTYMCMVSSSPPVSLNHSVDVQYPPKVTSNPQNGVLIVKQGSPASLVCNAEGNPQPSVTWTKKGGKLPSGETKLESQMVKIGAAERTHIGNYVCTVDNGIGPAVVKNFRLEVNFAPEIDVMNNMVHTGAGYEAQLVCKVHGQPMPEVTWARSGGPALDPEHHVESREGGMYSLSIDKVMDSDMGMYTCRAKSSLGTAAAPIEVTGLPKSVLITSNPNGDQADSYTMQWNVESYAPIQEYKVIYKMTQEGGKEVTEPQQWEQVIVAAPAADGATSVLYTYTYTLSELRAAAVYEAIVTARNKYGWSAEPAQPFKLSTRGAISESSAADLTGGEALGSKDPNAPSSAPVLRGSLVAGATLLVALIISS